MTNADAYTIGWVYGLIVQATGSEPDQNAAQKPYTSLGRLMVSHAAPGMVSDELSMQIGAALASIENMEIPAAGSEEPVQSQDIKSPWNLGYFAGIGGRPLDNWFDIEAARRKKKLTQAKLADMMGVDQGMVSRWESGKVTPNAENMRRLREILK